MPSPNTIFYGNLEFDDTGAAILSVLYLYGKWSSPVEVFLIIEQDKVAKRFTTNLKNRYNKKTVNETNQLLFEESKSYDDRAIEKVKALKSLLESNFVINETRFDETPHYINIFFFVDDLPYEFDFILRKSTGEIAIRYDYLEITNIELIGYMIDYFFHTSKNRLRLNPYVYVKKALI